MRSVHLLTAAMAGMASLMGGGRVWNPSVPRRLSKAAMTDPLPASPEKRTKTKAVKLFPDQGDLDRLKKARVRRERRAEARELNRLRSLAGQGYGWARLQFVVRLSGKEQL